MKPMLILAVAALLSACIAHSSFDSRRAVDGACVVEARALPMAASLGKDAGAVGRLDISSVFGSGDVSARFTRTGPGPVMGDKARWKCGDLRGEAPVVRSADGASEVVEWQMLAVDMEDGCSVGEEFWRVTFEATSEKVRPMLAALKLDAGVPAGCTR